MRLFSSVARERRSLVAVLYPTGASTCFSLKLIDAVGLVLENFLSVVALPTHAALRL